MKTTITDIIIFMIANGYENTQLVPKSHQMNGNKIPLKKGNIVRLNYLPKSGYYGIYKKNNEGVETYRALKNDVGNSIKFTTDDPSTGPLAEGMIEKELDFESKGEEWEFPDEYTGNITVRHSYALDKGTKIITLKPVPSNNGDYYVNIYQDKRIAHSLTIKHNNQKATYMLVSCSESTTTEQCTTTEHCTNTKKCAATTEELKEIEFKKGTQEFKFKVVPNNQLLYLEEKHQVDKMKVIKQELNHYEYTERKGFKQQKKHGDYIMTINKAHNFRVYEDSDATLKLMIPIKPNDTTVFKLAKDMTFDFAITKDSTLHFNSTLYFESEMEASIVNNETEGSQPPSSDGTFNVFINVLGWISNIAIM